MALVTFLYQDNPDAKPDELLYLDATIREVHTWSAEVAKHDIELGGDNVTTKKITDHVINNGITLQLTGVVSDDPINISSALIGGAAGIIGGAIGGGLGAITTGILSKQVYDTLTDAVKPSDIAYEVLDKIYKDGIPISIQTGLNLYVNMGMENLTIERTAQSGGGLSIEARFFQMDIVESDVVEIPESAQATEVAGDEKKTGKEATDVASATQSESFLIKVGRFIGIIN